LISLGQFIIRKIILIIDKYTESHYNEYNIESGDESSKLDTAF
jgi:hypothetical protein